MSNAAKAIATTALVAVTGTSTRSDATLESDRVAATADVANDQSAARTQANTTS